MGTHQQIVCILFLLTGAACGGGTGSAEVRGDVGGASLRPGTVFAWLDQKGPSSEEYWQRERELLHVVFSGASFDPSEDLRLRSEEDKLEMWRDVLERGSLHLLVSNVADVDPPTELGLPPEPEVGAAGSSARAASEPSIAVGYTLVPRERDGDALPPVPAYGSKGTYWLTLLATGPELAGGTLALRIERGPADPPDAVTGELEIEFKAPLFLEGRSECNAQVFNVWSDEDCEDH